MSTILMNKFQECNRLNHKNNKYYCFKTKDVFYILYLQEKSVFFFDRKFEYYGR
jgi:hypothetical protein